MTPRCRIPAVVLFAAAAGWAFLPPRAATVPTSVAVQQLRVDGRASAAFRTAERDATLARFAPIIGAGLLVCGLIHAARPGTRGD